MEESNNQYYYLIGAVIFIIAYFSYVKLTDNSTKAPNVDRADTIDATVVCKKFVKKRIKTPATADFGGFESDNKDIAPGMSYTVSAYVDAQNSFGANVRNDFTCKVRYEGGGTFTLVNLSFKK